VGLATSYCKKNKIIMKILKEPRTLADSLDKRPMYVTFGTWNVRNLYKAGSLVTISVEVSKYKLDLVGVQEVRWEGHKLNTHFYMQRGMRIMN
jgi:hypothetical protein